MAQPPRAGTILQVKVDHFKTLRRNFYRVTTPAFQFAGDNDSGTLLVEAIGFVLLRNLENLKHKDVTISLALGDGTRKLFKRKTTVKSKEELYLDGTSVSKKIYRQKLQELRVYGRWCVLHDWNTLAHGCPSVLAQKFKALREVDYAVKCLEELFGASEEEKAGRMVDRINEGFNFAFRTFYEGESEAELVPLDWNDPLKGLRIDLEDNDGEDIPCDVGLSAARASFALLFAINQYQKSPILVVEDMSSTQITMAMLQKLSERKGIQIVGTGLPIAGVEGVNIIRQ